MKADGDASADRRGRRAAWPQELLLAVMPVVLVSVVAVWVWPGWSHADIVMTYLLAVLIAAFYAGRRASVTASLLSVAAFNFFFVEPLHTFAVNESRNFATFLILLGVGLATSTLAERLRQQQADALARERRTATLLALTRSLVTGRDEATILQQVVTEASSTLARGASVWTADEAGALRCTASAGGVDPLRCAALAERTRSTGRLTWDEDACGVPLGLEVGGEGPERLGVLVMVEPAADTLDLVENFARQITLALASLRHAAAAEAATLRARAEELRSALLSTVSHDLRTPLASITGATTALLQHDLAISEPDRVSLLRGVRDEAARMERLVHNLLEMTRLSTGDLPLRAEWVPLEEVVGAAFVRVESALAGHPVTISLPRALPMVEIDPVLIEHLLVNLLENAVRHTPPGTPVWLRATVSEAHLRVEVSDAGPGLPPGDLRSLFDPFVRASSASGSGLGLAICRGICQIHGGEIHAQRRDPGACFVVVLPRRAPPGPPPEPPESSRPGPGAEV